MNPRHRRQILTGVVAALVVGIPLTAFLLARPPVYEGETSLIARPVTDILGPAANQFGAVVALGLPALPELAASPTVLGAVQDAVPDAPGPAELADAVDVALVPGAGVARVTVRAASAEQASALTVAMVDALVATDFLAPAAGLEALDDEPRVTSVAPPLLSGPAIGPLAAILVGIALALAAGRVRLHGIDARGVHSALDRAGHPPVAVLDGQDPALSDRISALQRASGRPVRVLPVGPGRAEHADRLRQDLGDLDVPLGPTDRSDEPRSVVAVLDARTTAPDELAAATAGLPEKSVVLAVVLS